MKTIVTIFVLILSLQLQAQNGWYQRATFPGTPRVLPASFVIGDDIYLCGGVLYDSTQLNIVVLNDCWRYNTIQDQWFQIDSVPAQYVPYKPISFSLNGKGYLVILSYTPFLSNVWEYDPGTTNWLQKNDAPVGIRVNFSSHHSFARDGFSYHTLYHNNNI